MYLMRAIVTIDSRQIKSRKSQNDLQKALSRVLSFFQPYGIIPEDKTGQYQYYYENEEAEMRCYSNIAVSVTLHRRCVNFREVALLSQIVQTTVTWLDDPSGYSYRCQILAPYVYAKNGDAYVLP